MQSRACRRPYHAFVASNETAMHPGCSCTPGAVLTSLRRSNQAKSPCRRAESESVSREPCDTCCLIRDSPWAQQSAPSSGASTRGLVHTVRCSPSPVPFPLTPSQTTDSFYAAFDAGVLAVFHGTPASADIAALLAPGAQIRAPPSIAAQAAAAAPAAAPAVPAMEVDQTLNPAVAALKPSKTMALTDLARQMREDGVNVIGLAAGEPDFDTPAAIIEAGVEALRWIDECSDDH